MSISLYRKYRPVRFEDVVGQAHVTRTLVNAIRQDRVSHAYLFAGPRGTGKTSTAKILAMSLNCEAGGGRATPQPDGSCPRCQDIRRGSSIDVIEMDAASNRRVEEVTEILLNKVHFAPIESRMKVYVVDEVHMLSETAFNALLKTLEEPPAHVVFILATTAPQQIPPTILSRCQRFDFRRPSLAEIVSVLNRIADGEGFQVTENTLTVIARSSAGSFRDAVGTLDQLHSYCGSTISMQDALALLGVAQQDLLFELVDMVDEGDTRGALLFVERLTQTGADVNQFLKDLLGHLRDLYVMQHTLEPPVSMCLSEEHLDALRSQANRVTTGRLVAFIDLIGEAQRAVRQGADARLELELLLMKLTRPDTDATLRGVVQRLERLENALQPEAIRTHFRTASTVERRSDVAPNATVFYAAELAQAGASPGAEETGRFEETTRAGDGQPRSEQPRSPALEEEERRPEPHIKPTLENIRRAWPIVLGAVKRHRAGFFALLNEGRPEALEDGQLVIGFPRGMEFQASQVNRPDNSLLLAETLRELTGQEMRVAARAAGEQEEPPESEQDARILTSDELIQLLKQEFDARPVDET